MGPLAKRLGGRKRGGAEGGGENKRWEGWGGMVVKLGGGIRGSAIGGHCAEMAPERN